MGVTKRFMDWYQGNNDKEREAPRGGIRRVGYVLWNYPGRMITVNLIFLLCCLPVVTIPAAVAAQRRYLSKIYRIGYGFGLDDYKKEFRQGILKNFPLGIGVFLFLAWAVYLLSLAGNFAGSSSHDVLIGCGLASLAVGTAFSAFAFTLSCMVELPWRHLLRNSVLLLFLEWKRGLFAAAESIVYWGILLALAPWSLFWILLMGMSFQSLILYAITEPAILKRIIIPYEEEKKNS